MPKIDTWHASAVELKLGYKDVTHIVLSE